MACSLVQVSKFLFAAQMKKSSTQQYANGDPKDDTPAQARAHMLSVLDGAPDGKQIIQILEAEENHVPKSADEGLQKAAADIAGLLDLQKRLRIHLHSCVTRTNHSPLICAVFCDFWCLLCVLSTTASRPLFPAIVESFEMTKLRIKKQKKIPMFRAGEFSE